MCVVSGSSCVRLPEFTRFTTFRWTLTVAGAFVLCTLLLFGFVYWESAIYMVRRYDTLLAQELRVFAANTPERRLQEIEDRLQRDPEHTKVAGLFGADGRRIAGNLERLPSPLPSDRPTEILVVRIDDG